MNQACRTLQPTTQAHFQQLETQFGQWLQLLGYAQSSVYHFPLHVREFLHYLEQQGITQLEYLQQRHTKAFFTFLSEREHQRQAGQGLSAAYLNKYLQALKLLSRYLRQTGQSDWSMPKQSIQVPQQLTTCLTPAEIQALYAACAEDILGLRDRAMLAIFYGCGLRRNEGVQLDLTDVLLPNGLLYVRKGKNYTERYVPLSAQIQSDLQRYLEESRPFFHHSHQQKAFFLSKKGKRAAGQSLNLRLQRLVRMASIEKEVSLHTLRHSIATHLLHNGMAIQQVARFLGHQSIESTQIYTQQHTATPHY